MLLVIVVVLFAPVRYKLTAKYNKNDGFVFNGLCTWLLFVRASASYFDEKFAYKVKVFFYTLLGSDKKARTKSPSKMAKNVEDDSSSVEDVKDVTNDVSDRAEAKNLICEKEIPDDVSEDNNPGKRKNFKFHFPWPSEIYMKITDLYFKVCEFIDEILRKVKEILRKKDEFLKQIADPSNRELVIFVMKQIKALFSHILPRKHKVYMKVGFSNPGLTGELLGIYSVINSNLGLNFTLEPDFDNEVFEFDAYLSGRIRGINLVIIAIKLYNNKTIRKFIRRN